MDEKNIKRQLEVVSICVQETHYHKLRLDTIRLYVFEGETHFDNVCPYRFCKRRDFLMLILSCWFDLNKNIHSLARRR